MTFRTTPFLISALAALATCACSCARADDVEPQPPLGNVNASMYGESVTLPREAAVCAERVPGYAPRFQAVFDRWRADNVKQIADGDRVLHASAKKAGADADAGLARLGDAKVDRLRKISPELFARHCDLILESLAPAVD